jgi:hypothetical protein
MSARTKKMIGSLAPLLIGINIQICAAVSTPYKASLCDLQRGAKQGERRLVEVGGVYSDGFAMGVLTDTACPSERTWVELNLRSTANKETLRSILDSKGHASVVFEGEFFGPTRPDPNLPEAIRKSYEPGWGHLGGFRTKLVVHVVRRVKPG